MHVALVVRRRPDRRRSRPARASARTFRTRPAPERAAARAPAAAGRDQPVPLAPGRRHRGPGARGRRHPAGLGRRQDDGRCHGPCRRLRPPRRHVRVGLGRTSGGGGRGRACTSAGSTGRPLVYNNPDPVAARPPGLPTGDGRADPAARCGAEGHPLEVDAAAWPRSGCTGPTATTGGRAECTRSTGGSSPQLEADPTVRAVVVTGNAAGLLRRRRQRSPRRPRRSRRATTRGLPDGAGHAGLRRPTGVGSRPGLALRPAPAGRSPPSTGPAPASAWPWPCSATCAS